MSRLPALVFCLIAAAAPAAAQSMPPPGQTGDPFAHGRPAGQPPAAGALPLSLRDAIARGLDQNLGPLTQDARVQSAQGARWRALSEWLPHLAANVRESDQITNLAAFGFTGFAGIPSVIGPFNVFDARVTLSAPILDISAHRDTAAATAALEAEKFTEKDARVFVMLVVANLYFQSVADIARVDAAKAQVTTAEALVQLTQDQQRSGLVAGIAVVQQQVELEAARQRLILATNDFEKRKLVLGRAIGLPPGQSITLTDALDAPAAAVPTLDAAVAQAMESRDDLKTAEARARAAHASHAAAVASALPTFRIDADFGLVGSTPSNAGRVYTVAATFRVPIFEGGATRGRVLQADADMRIRDAELADLKAGVQYDVAAALLDVASAAAAIETSRNGKALAQQQLDQAQDRFRAGVASTVELVQAQDAMAAASDRYVGSLYSSQLARTALARALGITETQFITFVGGSR